MKKTLATLAYYLERFISRSEFITHCAVKFRDHCQTIIGFNLGSHPRHKICGETGCLKKIAPHCSVCIDIGANVGYWTDLVVKSEAKLSKIVLFDPSISCYTHLKQKYNGRLGYEVEHAALSDIAGEFDFYEQDGCQEGSSLFKREKLQSKKTTVRVATLDEEIKKHGIEFLDLLKIDTEGNDYKVLLGAKEHLCKQLIRFIQFEYSEVWCQAGSTLDAATQYLDECGYRLYVIKEDGLIPFHYKSYGEFFRHANFLAVRKSETIEIS